MVKKLPELILMALFFGCCLWANAGEASDREAAALIEKEASAPLMSFEAWKAQRVHSAQQALEKAQMVPAPKEPEAGEWARRMEYNLEMAHSLTIQHYFDLYMKHKTPEEIENLAKSLSAPQMAQLLISYRDLSALPTRPPAPEATKVLHPAQK